MSAQQSTTQLDLHSSEKIGNAPCKSVLVLPVRYALCSDENSKLSAAYKPFVETFCPIPEEEPYCYTLRLLRPKSHLYMYAEGDDDISQFTVGKDNALELAKGSCVSKHFSVQDCCLQIADLSKQMWIAVSDANWTQEFRNTVKANPALRMQEFNPQTRSSEKSLVSKGIQKDLVTELSNLVQEFREQPGYLRAMHEYEKDIATLLDTDLTHLKEPTSDKELVLKRWKWSATPFVWKNIKDNIALRDLETKLKSHPCSMFIALADPVGMAMDCTSLNAAAQQACTDIMTWYGPAFTLAKKTEFFDATMKHFQRTARCSDRGDRGPIYITAGKNILGYAPIIAKILPPGVLDNTKFWWKLLTAKGQWSFVNVMRDFEIDEAKPDVSAQDTLALCIKGLTSLPLQVEHIHKELQSSQGLPFIDLSIEIIKAGCQTPEIRSLSSEDKRKSLGVLATAFSGIMLDVHSKDADITAEKKLLMALEKALEMYFVEMDEAEKSILKTKTGFVDLTFKEMQLLTLDAVIHDRGNIKTGLRYRSFDESMDRIDKIYRTFQSKETKDAGGLKEYLAMPGQPDAVPFYLAEKIKEDRQGLFRLTKKGKKIEFNDNLRQQASIVVGLTVLKGGLLVHSMNSALDVLFQEKEWDEKLYAAITVLTSAGAAAETAVSLYDDLIVLSIAGTNEALSILKSSNSKVLHTFLTRDHILKFRTALKIQLRSKTPHWNTILAKNKFMLPIAGFGLSTWDAWKSYNKGEYAASFGSALVAAGSLLLMPGFQRFFFMACLSSGALTVVMLVGALISFMFTKSPLERRVANSYFGEDSRLYKEIEEDVSQVEITRFSYSKEYVPPQSLFQPDAQNVGPMLCTRRNKAIIQDLDMFELIELQLEGELEFDKAYENLSVYFFTTYVTPTSTLKISKGVVRNTFAGYRMFDGPDLTKELHNAKWTTMTLRERFCWHCTIPWKESFFSSGKESNYMPKRFYMAKNIDCHAIDMSLVERPNTAIYVTAEFTYSNEGSIKATDDLVAKESAGADATRDELEKSRKNHMVTTAGLALFPLSDRRY